MRNDAGQGAEDAMRILDGGLHEAKHSDPLPFRQDNGHMVFRIGHLLEFIFEEVQGGEVGITRRHC